MTGTTLAHYQVLEKLGQGGMGEVYRASDSRLGREVAIKVLPDDFVRDQERLARFEREARVLASLNHPNIAAIYGFEQSGGVPFLVMEYVAGETLKGPLPLDETVAIARQIADALEAAHENGIIHRDLKPDNVKMRPDGRVKVLDFGLAKALEVAGPGDDPGGVRVPQRSVVIVDRKRTGPPIDAGEAIHAAGSCKRSGKIVRRTRPARTAASW